MSRIEQRSAYYSIQKVLTHLSRTATVLMFVPTMLGTTGCISNAVVFSTSTRLGIEISAAEGGQQHALIGYKRFEGVTMPMREDQGELISEAYSIYAFYKLETGSLLLPDLKPIQVDQRFAMGEAALAATGSLNETTNTPSNSGAAEEVGEGGS